MGNAVNLNLRLYFASAIFSNFSNLFSCKMLFIMPTEPNNLRTKSKNFPLVVYYLFARIIVVFSLSLTL